MTCLNHLPPVTDCRMNLFENKRIILLCIDKLPESCRKIIKKINKQYNIISINIDSIDVDNRSLDQIITGIQELTVVYHPLNHMPEHQGIGHYEWKFKII